MKHTVQLLLSVFLSLHAVYAQQLYPDSISAAPENQLSMVIPPDTSVVATIAIDSIPYPFIWFDTEEGWRFPNIYTVTIYPGISVCDWGSWFVTIATPEIKPPLTETALGLLAADPPSAIRLPPSKNIAHAAGHFEAFVSR